ncbi:hypothetical protein L226DRAFT_529731 [Lentinus tigrinus ALCF2SS1-7]|uniref:Transmembrane protein n=1 Tax=Lentinus tigrinus ALCF2SS1-6 TaxID=1328759 RepID=A0A5C2SUS3_9APHY|nr:hypothetical protein L227DRAFT_597093 [Lentinus tigrinus ALCF2SS1-6]RPD81322.1 hypothetical protein L226DRAFT_529731 [Lentinus tigrinus ALCF2SS1-7]
MSGGPQQSGKPLTPPPAYSEHLEPHEQHPSTNQGASTSSSSPLSPGLSFPTHAAYYGPTPLPQQTQLLPYYDPRSPYAVAEANHRARWRFITAALWAVAILTFVSFITGWEVEAMRAREARMEGVFAR